MNRSNLGLREDLKKLQILTLHWGKATISIMDISNKITWLKNSD